MTNKLILGVPTRLVHPISYDTLRAWITPGCLYKVTRIDKDSYLWRGNIVYYVCPLRIQHGIEEKRYPKMDIIIVPKLQSPYHLVTHVTSKSRYLVVTCGLSDSPRLFIEDNIRDFLEISLVSTPDQ